MHFANRSWLPERPDPKADIGCINTERLRAFNLYIILQIKLISIWHIIGGSLKSIQI